MLLSHILAHRFIILAYDRDAQHQPFHVNGERAHYLLIHGIMMDTSTSAHDDTIYVIISHGLSSIIQVMPLNLLLASNAQLEVPHSRFMLAKPMTLASACIVIDPTKRI